MARAKKQDFLHNFRFHVVVNYGGIAQLGTGGTKPSAGFNSVTAPSLKQEAVEYREGHYLYTQKYSGLPSVDAVTMTRGVALGDGTMFAWMRDVVEGNNEYRADISVYHYHRDAKPATNSDPSQEAGPMPITSGATPGHLEYKLFEAFPTSYKTSGDLSATSSDVSIQELELSFESFAVIDSGATP